MYHHRQINLKKAYNKYIILIDHLQRREFESRSSEVYSIEHCVIKFNSELKQVGGFLFPPQIKLTVTI